MSEVHRYGIHRVTEMIPWQKSWERLFEEEKGLIVDAMAQSGLACTVYHVGSTSVKGMISKPIIDILLCPEKNAALEAYIPVLEKIGYTNLGESGRAGRFFLSKGEEENRTFYLHLCHENHQVAIDQKLFQFIERNDVSVFYSYKIRNSLFCEYAYVIDLDAERLSFFVGSQTLLQEGNPCGTEAVTNPYVPGAIYYPCRLAAVFTCSYVRQASTEHVIDRMEKAEKEHSNTAADACFYLPEELTIVLKDWLFLFPLYDFSLGKQFILSICTDGMQLVPTHQIVDVLTGTIKNAACLGCADNAVLHIMMQRV